MDERNSKTIICSIFFLDIVEYSKKSVAGQISSPKYMSPEQVMGKAIDQRSDIFSLGVMLYEMLVGKAPFVGDNVNAIMYQTLNGVPPAPSTINSAVPEMLNFIVAKALGKALDDRYQNAKELANDLRDCRDRLPRAGDLAGGAARSSVTVGAIVRQDDTVEVEAPPTLGLSKAFDSFGATMRLAAMTTSKAEVDELSKTLKMARPSLAEINAAETKLKPIQSMVAAPINVAVAQPASPMARPAPSAQEPAKDSGNLWIIVVAVVILGLLVALFLL
jgi:serine/threonine-protein kinase